MSKTKEYAAKLRRMKKTKNPDQSAMQSKKTDYLQQTKLSSYPTISRGQAGMLYRGFKEGKLSATQEEMSWMYNRMTGDSYPSTNSVDTNIANKLRVTVTVASKGDWKTASSLFKDALSAYDSAYTSR